MSSRHSRVTDGAIAYRMPIQTFPVTVRTARRDTRAHFVKRNGIAPMGAVGMERVSSTARDTTRRVNATTDGEGRIVPNGNAGTAAAITTERALRWLTAFGPARAM